jgi:hypothetical protein
MAMPNVGPGGLGIIETMMGFPDPDPRRLYEFFRGNIRDKESKETMFPVEYLFKQNVPGALTEDIDPVEVAINTMDHFGIDRSMIGIEGDPGVRALTEYPERFIPSCSADANNGVDEVRKIRRRLRCPSTMRVGIRFTRCAPSWVSPSSSAPESPVRGSRACANTSSFSTSSVTTSPNSRS